MDKIRIFSIIIASTAAFLAGTASYGGNLRTISSKEGISNNSILCLGQDPDGYIWLGTCEGLNLWDGQRMARYPQEGSRQKPLSGNLIEKIQATQDGYWWIRTNYGLDLMDNNKVIEQHKEFQGIYFLISRSKEETIVVTSPNRFYGYCSESSSFREIEMPGSFSYDRYITSWAGKGDSIYLFMRDGVYRCTFKKDQPDRTCRIDGYERIFHAGISYSFADEDIIIIIDGNGILYTFNPETETIEYIADISPETKRYGKISYAIRHGNDFFISFLFDGVTILRHTPENADKYSFGRLEINCGVFYLMNDSRQDIVWIGTDGQGLFMYSNDELSFHSYTYDRFPLPNLSKPVRSILKDSEETLWIATKGEGIILFPDFSTSSRPPYRTMHINGPDAGLADNAVFALEESHRRLVWIGSEGYGINYRHLSGGPVHTLGGEMPEDLRYIHAIHEDHDTLWVATVGCGVFRLAIGENAGKPYIKEWKKLDFGKEMENKNFFFTIYADRDNSLWIGNRGGGLVHYIPGTGEYTITKFDDSRAEIANDVWSILRGHDGRLWVGTSWGLLCIREDGTIRETPIRNIIHGILEDNDGKLYLTTNSGLIRYDPQTSLFARYGYSYGINTIEYSDGAAFRDRSGILFFGGTNGFVAMEQSRHRPEPFTPELRLRSVQVNDTHIPVEDAIGKDGTLVIGPHERLYGVRVSAIDYINGSNYAYLYNIHGSDDHWTESSPDIKFTEKRPGRYRLNVKYKNIVTGETSPVISLKIRIKAPWYSSIYAICTYFLLSIMFSAMGGLFLYRRRKQKKISMMEKIEAKRKEEALDSKIHLLENLTQQMAVPVSMISVPCQQILEYPKSDEYIKAYSRKIIQQNTKLGHLIQMLHNFRESSETGNINAKIFPITEYMSEITGSYVRLAQSSGITLEIDMPQDLLWTSDPRRVSAITDMTMTNAFLHVARNGRIAFSISADEDTLAIRTYVEGKWLEEEDFRRITDRYGIMDDLQKKSRDGESFQDEMRLAVCFNYVTGLGGTMDFTRSEGSFSFEIRLPALKISDSNEAMEGKATEDFLMESHIMMIEKDAIHQFEMTSDRQTMFIIGSDTGIINSIADMFSEEYNVKTFSKPSRFREEMQSGHPDIIVCENIPMKSGISELMSSIKSDKITVKIPIILITSLQHADALTDEYADSVLTLPINVKALRSTVKQNLNRMSSLKEYYNSSISTYVFSEGKMLHSEDKQFLEKLFRIISDNISDSEMTTSTIAEKMGMSLRNLYRRLNGIINITPSNIIREYRLKYAEHLLTKTKLSVDEIIYKSGYSNRGTFFKNFSAKYGCTPKSYRKQQIGEI
ncbi:MAG: helix-turn-helix domain-containing protein [Bacteroidales bacterium]|nr:helix-turn-helix domain-containing protein [Bacteroidales bacterium]